MVFKTSVWFSGFPPPAGLGVSVNSHDVGLICTYAMVSPLLALGTSDHVCINPRRALLSHAIRLPNNDMSGVLDGLPGKLLVSLPDLLRMPVYCPTVAVPEQEPLLTLLTVTPSES